jgi:hypothetical protein
VWDCGFGLDRLFPNVKVFGSSYGDQYALTEKLLRDVDTDTITIISPYLLAYDPEVMLELIRSIRTGEVTVAGDAQHSLPQFLFSATMKTLTPLLQHQSIIPDTDSQPFEAFMRYCIREKVLIKHKKAGFSDVLLGYPQRLKVPNAPKTGLHAILNKSTGYKMLANCKDDRDGFEMQKKALPYPKLMRSLMWQYVFDHHAGIDNSDHYMNVLESLRIPWTVWQKYYSAFMDHHDWLQQKPVAIKA